MGSKMSKKGFESVATEHALYPQEKPAKVSIDNQRLAIGIPKETSYQENRIGLTPKAVQLLVRNGHSVTIESGAGLGSKFSDNEYSEVGAQIVYSPNEVYENDIILKIQPPTDKELKLFKSNQFLISAMQIADLQEQDLQKLKEKKITALGYELLENKGQELPIMRAMGEIAGNVAIFIAAEYLSTSKGGRGSMLGAITGVAPTKIVIIGAGTVAEYASRAGLGFGAEIRVFDNHIYRLRRLKNAISAHLYTSTIDAGLLADELSDADVVIGALRPENGITPCVVTEDMVAGMRPGSVIVDVSIDHGGCFETSEVTNFENPVFVKHDVIHYCVPNIASRYARTASTALSNIFSPILIKMGRLGGFEEMILMREEFMRGIYMYKGSLTNQALARRFGMQYKDLRLLLACRY